MKKFKVIRWLEDILTRHIINNVEITLRHWCSTVMLLHIFRTPFPKNTSGGLLLNESFIPYTSTENHTNFFESFLGIALVFKKFCEMIKIHRHILAASDLQNNDPLNQKNWAAAIFWQIFSEHP